MNAYDFQEVSLLITHYNRSSSLERLLTSFENLNCRFNEIVVSDDGSNSEQLEHLSKLQQQFSFRLIGSDTNHGLGHNLNKGQQAVLAPLTLYVQEDFVPTPLFPDNFQRAITLLNENVELDVIRFYAYFAYPYLKPYKQGLSEMLIQPWQLNYKKIYAYSDHPHLRRSTFLQRFGKYAEGIKGDRTEYRMCVSFIQNHGKGLFFDGFTRLFKQINSDEEPSTMQRSNLTQSKNPLIKLGRDVYRQIKYNYDIYFYKEKK